MQNQKTFSDYGLPSAKDYPSTVAAASPVLLPKTRLIENAQSQLAKILLGNQYSHRRVQTPLELVVIRKDFLPHVVAKRSAARERYANFIIPTLAEPNEIWLTAYKDGFRRRYIKFFHGKKDVLVIVKENKDGGLFWNMIPAEPRYIDKQRIGVLLYKR